MSKVQQEEAECFICGDGVCKFNTLEPTDDAAFVYATKNQEAPEGSLGVEKFHFCSIECMTKFVPEEHK